nr:unnamed protein product [Callosobruchus chinensis]
MIENDLKCSDNAIRHCISAKEKVTVTLRLLLLFFFCPVGCKNVNLLKYVDVDLDVAAEPDFTVLTFFISLTYTSHKFFHFFCSSDPE